MASDNTQYLVTYPVNMATVNDNRAYNENDIDLPYENNFIDIPWDDRSKSSKFGIISLLLSMAGVIVICVCNSFIMYYASGHSTKYTVHNNCPLINPKETENYTFAARVHSISSNKLLCMGAVLSSTTVLVDAGCVRDGPVLVLVGKSIATEPRCKKGYPVDADAEVEMDHLGLVSKKIMMLSTKVRLDDCADPISRGFTINWKSPAYIIGRPFTASARGLTKQPVTVIGMGNCTLPDTLSSTLNRKHVICVKDFGRCLIHTGDLLVQDGRLFGIASTNVLRAGSTTAYFADVTNNALPLQPHNSILGVKSSVLSGVKDSD